MRKPDFTFWIQVVWGIALASFLFVGTLESLENRCVATTRTSGPLNSSDLALAPCFGMDSGAEKIIEEFDRMGPDVTLDICYDRFNAVYGQGAMAIIALGWPRKVGLMQPADRARREPDFVIGLGPKPVDPQRRFRKIGDKIWVTDSQVLP